MLHTQDGLDEATRSEIERRLSLRLLRLTESLEAHERQTSELLPKDPQEAASIIEEIDRLEAEEDRESDEILQVQQALERLQAGTYGICVRCEHRIPRERLLSVPYALLCLRCKTEDERV